MSFIRRVFSNLKYALALAVGVMALIGCVFPGSVGGTWMNMKFGGKSLECVVDLCNYVFEIVIIPFICCL